jgi:hypothetical protein
LVQNDNCSLPFAENKSILFHTELVLLTFSKVTWLYTCETISRNFSIFYYCWYSYNCACTPLNLSWQYIINKFWLYLHDRLFLLDFGITVNSGFVKTVEYSIHQISGNICIESFVPWMSDRIHHLSREFFVSYWIFAIKSNFNR